MLHGLLQVLLNVFLMDELLNLALRLHIKGVGGQQGLLLSQLTVAVGVGPARYKSECV